MITENDPFSFRKGVFSEEGIMTREQTVKEIARKIAAQGGRAYYVGGFVRDRLLGIENKDIDIEVHSVDVQSLRKILSEAGEILEMGESFGIFSLKGFDIDIAMPRSEAVTGRGHRDFAISVDPFIGTKKAAERRDFTVNALMEDVLTGEIIDHFGGKNDLKNKILRHVNDSSFPEDPLRVLRLARFSARFDFSVAEETKELCRHIDLSSLSKERIEGEMKKALMKAEKPSVFFEVLREVNGLDYWFPEIKKLIGLPQNPVFHPEGDVWVHTMMVLDTGALYREKTSEPYYFMLSCLCHDLGKIISTEEIDGVIHSYEHEKRGISLIKDYLGRITNEKELISYVLNMTLLHMKPFVMTRAGSSVKSVNKLFDESIAPEDLIYLSSCDNFGRHDDIQKELLEKYEVYKEYMSRPFVQGKDLIEAGLVPNKSFSEILAYAHKLRLAGIKKESALKQTLSYARKFKK